MKEKIELQLADIANQMKQNAENYRAVNDALAAQELLLNQALALAQDVAPDVQAILDDAAKP